MKENISKLAFLQAQCEKIDDEFYSVSLVFSLPGLCATERNAL